VVAAPAGRAAVARETGDLDTDLTDLQRAVELAPDDATLRYHRAFVHQRANRWDAALADLDMAAERNPDDPDVVSARDRCRRRLAVT
jgi:tetratricopeptide (TPR) repeat protein